MKAKGPVSRRGTGLLLSLLLLPAAWACGVPEERVLTGEELRELGLPAGARLHRVTLGGRGAEEHAVPTRIQAEPGDGVEFRTVDHRVHTVTFLGDSLAPEVAAFLEVSGQTSSPPLVTRGSRFILRLEDAPPGSYFFVTQGHGGSAHGVVEVGASPAQDTSGSG